MKQSEIMMIIFLSYDARDSEWNNGTRWSDEFQFGSRAYFDLSSSPSVLRVQNIQAAEAGVYRCRVDFKSAPTRNSLVNISVIGGYLIMKMYPI